MVRYYKLFDLLNRMGMKKSDLRTILSPKTVAKLSKGEYISGEAVEKICLFLNCQPGDIMEIITEEYEIQKNIKAYKTNIIEPNGYYEESYKTEERENYVHDNDEILPIKHTIE